MGRFVITEEERREIRSMYFLEQQVPTGNATTTTTTVPTSNTTTTTTTVPTTNTTTTTTTVPKSGTALNTKQAWEAEIARVEREVGNPTTWTVDNWSRLQNTLKQYKKWLVSTPEGLAAGGNKVNPKTFILDLPDHLKSYLTTATQSGATFNTPQAWQAAIANVESELGDPSTWTMDDYNRSQGILNQYKKWRETTPEGMAVADSSHKPNEYVIPLPDHLKTTN